MGKNKRGYWHSWEPINCCPSSHLQSHPPCALSLSRKLLTICDAVQCFCAARLSSSQEHFTSMVSSSMGIIDAVVQPDATLMHRGSMTSNTTNEQNNLAIRKQWSSCDLCRKRKKRCDAYKTYCWLIRLDGTVLTGQIVWHYATLLEMSRFWFPVYIRLHL